MPQDTILVLEDDVSLRSEICDLLTLRGMKSLPAGTCAEAEHLWRTARPDLGLLEYRLPDGNALDLVPRLKSADPNVPLLILTGHGSIQLAVEAIKVGVEQFLTKPIENSALLMVIERCLDNYRNRQQLAVARTRIRRDSTDLFLGTSEAMRKLSATAHKILNATSPVLIQGETGTGKGVMARWLHQNGTRSARPFIDLNCGGLSRDLLETELFGHERGSFTGAIQNKTGLLEIGHRGTLFLDEIGDMDLQVQSKLLKVIEEKVFRRLGSTHERTVDTRLIAATHRDLRLLVQQKLFREDLYFRVSTITLFVPPLRHRAEDIPLLARALLNELTADLGMSTMEMDDDALNRLRAYSWPGNVRELKNVLERAVLLGDQKKLRTRDLDFDAPIKAEDLSGGRVRTLEEMERHYVTQVLETSGGRVAEAALKLGIPRSTLYHKLKEYRARELASEPEPHRERLSS